METTASSVIEINKFREITLKQLQVSRKKLLSALKKRWNPGLAGVILYFLPFIVLTTYGGKACPFIEGVAFSTVMMYIFISIFPLYLLRTFFLFYFGKKQVMEWSDTRYLLFEASFFVVWVGILATIASLFLHFSSESFIKLTAGSGLLSVFSVIDLQLIRKNHLLVLADKRNTTININRKKIVEQYNSFVSLKLKFVFTTILILVLVGIAFSLISYKNYEWLIHNIDEIDHWEGLLSVFKEILFVISVFMGQLVITVILYSNNIIVCFALLSRVISDLFDGKFDNRLLTLSNDEFGMMGENLNIISNELEEKQKIKTTFGKLVSPKVAEIMMNDNELKLGGVERETVILFSDIRNFTSDSAVATPSATISKLNSYFTKVVGFVEKHSGIVDKFMGDGLMALYGYDDPVRGVNDAVRSAMDMLSYIKKKRDGSAIGIGIHVGNAILGLIGSPQRLDFTAVGAEVNLASRLESATKENGVDLFLSGAAHARLCEELHSLNWKECHITVKGIEETLTVYGLKIL